MDSKQDRDPKETDGHAKESAVPNVIGLPQRSTTDPKNQDEEHEGTDVVTKASHGVALSH